jgi:hypothetical protein
LPQNPSFEKDERQAKGFCRTGEARLASLGLVREEGRWRTRACRRRDGAFDESDDGFAGAASFAAYTDRHGGFAFAEIILALCSIVSSHVFWARVPHDCRGANGGHPVTPKFGKLFASILSDIMARAYNGHLPLTPRGMKEISAEP